MRKKYTNDVKLSIHVQGGCFDTKEGIQPVSHYNSITNNLHCPTEEIPEEPGCNGVSRINPNCWY